MASNQYDLITKFKVDMGNFKSDMGKAQKTIGGTETGLRKLAGAAAVAFSATAVVGFAKSAIETTARLQAMDAQYAQVFKDDAGIQMMDRLKSISGDANIQIDRLVDSANKFGAQLKGAGVEGEQAMEMTETATRLAADSAAFFDTSMEAATGSISSFLKGNFAAGDAIGVFTNATQMSDAATARFGKSWQDLSEAQKQTLLLEKVEETYKLSGAMGQAARESESWENITGNLKATWDRFLTVVGGPLLQAVTPIIVGITDVIGVLQEAVNAIDFEALAKSNPIIQAVSDAFTFLKETVSQVGSYITGDFEALGEGANGLGTVFIDAFNLIQSAFSTAATILGGIWETIIQPIFSGMIGIVQDHLLPIFSGAFGLIGEIVGEVFSDITALWTEQLQPMFEQIMTVLQDTLAPVFEAVFPVIEELVYNALYTIWDVWTEYVSPALSAIVAFISDNLQPAFDEVFPVIQDIVNTVFTAISNFWTNTLQPVFTAVVAFVKDDLWPIFQKAFPIIQEAVGKAFSVIKSVWESVLKPAFQGVMTLINDNLMPAFNVAFPIIKDAVETAFNRMEWAWENILSPAFDAVKDILDNTIKPAFEKIFPKIQAAVEAAFKAIETVWNSVLKPAFDAIDSFVRAILQPAFEAAFPVIQGVVETAMDNVGIAIDFVTGVFDGIKLTIDNVIKWFTDLKTNITNTINGARDAVDTAITKIKGFFEFKWELPKLKLPTISITGKFSLAPPQIPKFGINWNAAGAIFDRPTIFNTAQGLQGVGEAGPEAIMPIKKLPALLKPYFIARDEAHARTAELQQVRQPVGQPVELTLRLGTRAFKVFVEDITKVQDGEIDLELKYT